MNTIGINPTNALNELPSEVVDSSRQIGDRCGASKNSSFIATGRGGIPKNPSQRRGSDRSWNDLRPLTATHLSVPMATVSSLHPLIEASVLHIDPSGTIVLRTGSANALVAAQQVTIQAMATCGMGELR